jgi:hypothetical protein
MKYNIIVVRPIPKTLSKRDIHHKNTITSKDEWRNDNVSCIYGNMKFTYRIIPRRKGKGLASHRRLGPEDAAKGRSSYKVLSETKGASGHPRRSHQKSPGRNDRPHLENELSWEPPMAAVRADFPDGGSTAGRALDQIPTAPGQMVISEK